MLGENIDWNHFKPGVALKPSQKLAELFMNIIQKKLWNQPKVCKFVQKLIF